jgi:ankyrin repeat protein
MSFDRSDYDNLSRAVEKEFQNALALAKDPKTNHSEHDFQSPYSAKEKKKVSQLYPIHWAVLHKNIDLIRALIKNDPRRLIQKTSDGYTPIEVATVLGEWEIATQIATEFANEFRGNIKNERYMDALNSAMIDAAQANKLDCVIALLKAGSSDNWFNIVDKNRNVYYSLHYAVKHRNIKMIQELIKAGYDPNKKGFAQKSPMDLANEESSADCILALKGLSVPSAPFSFFSFQTKKTEPKEKLEAKEAKINEAEVKEEKTKAEAKVKEAKEGVMVQPQKSNNIPLDKSLSSAPKQENVIDKLSFLIRTGNLKAFKTQLESYKEDKMNIRNSEGMTLTELAIIYDQHDIFSMLANNPGYQATSDSVFHIIKPEQIKKLKKKYNKNLHVSLSLVFDNALSLHVNDNKSSQYNSHLDSLHTLIEQIVTGCLSDNTLKKLAKKKRFKETVLNYLDKLLSSDFQRLNEIIKQDNEFYSKEKSVTPLAEFFGVKRRLTQTTTTTGTLARFIQIKGDLIKKNSSEIQVPRIYSSVVGEEKIMAQQLTGIVVPSLQPVPSQFESFKQEEKSIGSVKVSTGSLDVDPIPSAPPAPPEVLPPPYSPDYEKKEEQKNSISLNKNRVYPDMYPDLSPPKGQPLSEEDKTQNDELKNEKKEAQIPSNQKALSTFAVITSFFTTYLPNIGGVNRPTDSTLPLISSAGSSYVISPVISLSSIVPGGSNISLFKPESKNVEHTKQAVEKGVEHQQIIPNKRTLILV